MVEMNQSQLLLEFGLIGYIFLVAGVVFMIFLKSTPKETIPPEYFFKIREPSIRKKRKLGEEAAAKKKANIEL